MTTREKLKERLLYELNELFLLINQLVSGYTPNPKIIDMINKILDIIHDLGGML